MKTPSPILSSQEVLALEEVAPMALWQEDDEPKGYFIDDKAWSVGWLGDKRVRCQMQFPHS